VTYRWFAWHGTSLTLQVRVHARAKTASIDGLHVGRLKIRITTPPVDGSANRALSALMAKQFAVAVRRIEIVAGATSRDKTIRIDSPLTLPEWFKTLGGTLP